MSREYLWEIVTKFGCPEHFIKMIRLFHDDMMARVLNDEEASRDFPARNGIKQGYVLAPILFNMMFSAIVADDCAAKNPDVPIKYRTEEQLFDLRRLKTVTKVKETVIRDLLFAVYCALNLTTESDTQDNANKFSRACDTFGLIISTKTSCINLHQAIHRWHFPYK